MAVGARVIEEVVTNQKPAQVRIGAEQQQ